MRQATKCQVADWHRWCPSSRQDAIGVSCWHTVTLLTCFEKSVQVEMARRIQLAIDVQITAAFGGLGASAVYIGDASVSQQQEAHFSS